MTADLTLAIDALPARHREPIAALFAIDAAMADVLRTTSDPALGAIRLAWWREALQALDSAPPPAEPRLRAVADHLLAHRITGADLAALEDAWLPLLSPFPWGPDAAEGLRARGKLLFEIGARLLDGKLDEARAAGVSWSLADGARHCSDPVSRAFLVGEARAAITGLSRPDRALRPLTVIAALAAYDVLHGDLAKPGGAGRGLAAVLHRLFGTMPR